MQAYIYHAASVADLKIELGDRFSGQQLRFQISTQYGQKFI